MPLCSISLLCCVFPICGITHLLKKVKKRQVRIKTRPGWPKMKPPYLRYHFFPGNCLPFTRYPLLLLLYRISSPPHNQYLSLVGVDSVRPVFCYLPVIWIYVTVKHASLSMKFLPRLPWISAEFGLNLRASRNCCSASCKSKTLQSIRSLYMAYIKQISFLVKKFRLTIGCYNLAIFDCLSWVKYNEISAFKVRILCLSVWFFVCFNFLADKSISLTLTLKKIYFRMHNLNLSCRRAGFHSRCGKRVEAYEI